MNRTVATFFSTVGHPFVLLVVVFSALTLREVDLQESWPTLVALLGGLAVLGALIVVKKRRGHVSNLDVSDHAQRARNVYRPALLLVAGVTVVLYLTKQPFVGDALLFGALMLTCFLINTRLKISQHTVIATYTACLVLPIHLGWGLGLLVFAGLIARSRVVLGRHQPAEVAAGLVIGVLFGVLHWGLLG
jgi:membrane-associated phospholipid phosphatase